MKTYRASQLVKWGSGSEQVDEIQHGCDSSALSRIEERKEDLAFLSNYEWEHFKEYFTDTMEKYRLLYDAIVTVMSSKHKTGYPEHIYSIDLKDGSIETDKNGRRINYTTEILAPCTSTVLHYINNECNDLYAIFPPIKDEDRAIEKLIEEKQKEHQDFVEQQLATFEEEPELPFGNPAEEHCPTVEKLKQQLTEKKNKHALINIASDSMIPTDIYRLSITSRYPEDLKTLIEQFEEKFPDYITFLPDERNSYEKPLSENPRRYLDIKKIAKITIPETERYFLVEFQFKQTNTFFAHIRSHGVYEEFRILDTKYQALQKSLNKKKNPATIEETKNKITQLKKQCEEKRQLCVDIHKSAIHQSNFYVLNKIMWEDKNAEGLKRPKDAQGRYQSSIDFLEKNYIVESYEPFDGAMDFATSPSELLNKAYYLKMIGSLPESFDELGKNAATHINRAWENLTSSDIKNFDLITATAIKYQEIIRAKQKRKQMEDPQYKTNSPRLPQKER